MIRPLPLLAIALVSSAPVAASARRAPEPAPRAVVERFLADYAAERLEPMQSYIAASAEMRVHFASSGPMVLDAPHATAYLRSVFAQYATIALSEVTLTPAADGRTVFVEAKATYTDHAGASHSVGSVWAIEVVHGKIVRSRTYTIPA